MSKRKPPSPKAVPSLKPGPALALAELLAWLESDSQRIVEIQRAAEFGWLVEAHWPTNNRSDWSFSSEKTNSHLEDAIAHVLSRHAEWESQRRAKPPRKKARR